jgi:kynureninase
VNTFSDPLLRFPPEFPILEKTYLISNSLGAMPRTAARALADGGRRWGTAAVDFPNAREVARELNARGIVVDFRPGVGIRMSPHFYTEVAELDRVFDTFDGMLDSGAWRRWIDRPVIVT